MIQKSSLVKGLLLFVFCTLTINTCFAQQDPQYTQYMYNTMNVNPGYTGQREVLSIGTLYRAQWTGIPGAPKTQTFYIHSPLRNKRLGLGLSVVHDEIGPAEETYIDASFSYTIPLSDNDTKLSFGLKGGLHLLKTDWSKGRFQDPDPVYEENLNLSAPTFGAGFYLHNRKWYVGFSSPNVLATKHYDDVQVSIASESLHYYLIAGYVFDLSDQIKFKPSFLMKGVSGSSMVVDISANFLFSDKLTLGMGYRLDDSIAGLVGFQLNKKLFMGFAYDYTTTALQKYSTGTYEFFLRYELKSIGKVLSPRFF